MMEGRIKSESKEKSKAHIGTEVGGRESRGDRSQGESGKAWELQGRRVPREGRGSGVGGL